MKKIFVVLILVLFCSSNVVYAEKYDGYIYEGEKIPGIYFYKYRPDTEDEKYEYHNFHNQATFYRRSSDNSIVYCIESWQHLTGAQSGDYIELDKNNSKLNISNEDLDYINALAYYGYGYNENKYDHRDAKWYAITQYLIWEVSSPHIKHYFVDSLTSKTPINRFAGEIAEIKKLVKKHYLLPAVANRVIELDMQARINLYDNYYTLDDYIITNNNQNFTAVIEDNILKLSGLIPGEYIMNFKKKSERFQNTYKIYYSDDYQNALAVGNYNPLEFQITLKISAGKVIIKKEASIITSISNEETIKKKIGIDGAVLAIYAENDICDNNNKVIYPKDSLVTKIISQKEGNNLELPYGAYYVIEEQAPNGFLLNEKTYHFVSQPGKVNTCAILNETQKFRLKFNKICEDKNEFDNFNTITCNATFGLFANENIYNFNGDIIANKDTLISRINPEKEGEYNVLFDLPYGSYYVRELENNRNYQLDAKHYNFTFDFIDNGVSEQTITIIEDNTFINYLKRRNLIIYKKDANTGEYLSDATFIVYDENHQKLSEVTTDINGRIELSLPLGKYYFKELYAPDGYLIDSKEYLLNITEEREEYTLEIVNTKTPEIVEVESTSHNEYNLALTISILILYLGWKKCFKKSFSF